jgi:hypothetical protein
VFRVRYGECDAQKIVFNARWGDYIDPALERGAPGNVANHAGV